MARHHASPDPIEIRQLWLRVTSDPVARSASDGHVVFPGHTGTIYQAKGAEYLFRTRPRRLLLLPDGSTLSDRAVAKVRADDRGHDYVERRLHQFGAPRRLPGESGAAFLARALPAAGVRHLRHGGMHRYAFRLGRTRTQRAAVRIVVPGPVPAGSTLAYPKLPDAVQGVLW